MSTGRSRSCAPADEPVPAASASMCSASRACRCASTPSLRSPGSAPSSCRESCRISSIVMTSCSPRPVGHRPAPPPPRAACTRAHPSQRLVGAVVGVHRTEPAALTTASRGAIRQVRGQPAEVVHAARRWRAAPAQATGKGVRPAEAVGGAQDGDDLVQDVGEGIVLRGETRATPWAGGGRRRGPGRCRRRHLHVGEAGARRPSSTGGPPRGASRESTERRHVDVLGDRAATICAGSEPDAR